MGRSTSFIVLPLVLFFSLMVSGCEDDNALSPPRGPYEIVEIFDGDSFNLRSADPSARGAVIRVRIIGIDAPEKSQPYSQQAKLALEQMLTSGSIVLRPEKKDRFDRWLAYVEVNQTDIGLALIEGGWAWFFKRYRSDLSPELQAAYAQAEENARQQKLGLWAWQGPIEPPWKFRERINKEKRASLQSFQSFQPALAQGLVTANAAGNGYIQAFNGAFHGQFGQQIATLAR
jgi:micrococcal nuclease